MILGRFSFYFEAAMSMAEAGRVCSVVQCFKLRLLHQIQHTGKRRGLRYQGAAISCHISFGDPCHLRIKNDRFIYSAIS